MSAAASEAASDQLLRVDFMPPEPKSLEDNFALFPSSGNGRRMSEGEIRWLLGLAVFGSALTVLIVDFFTPLGIALWVFYVIPVTLSLWLWHPLIPFLSAFCTTIFMLVGLAASTAGIDPRIANINRGFGIFVVWVMATVGYFFVRNRLLVQHQQWLQTGRMGLNGKLGGEQEVEQLGDTILRFMTGYLGAHAGVLFVSDEGRFRRIASYSIPPEADIPESFLPGEGLPGQAVKDRRVVAVRQTPPTFVWVASSLGRGTPRALLVAPMEVDGAVQAVIELAFVEELPLTPRQEFLELAAESVATAVRSAHYRASLRNLLEESQRQAEELQVQSEELRVANEELAEQSRALAESQSRLEQQQIELEQTNSQLEEQAQQLENQRDDLARAQTAVEAKARELERASRYKSEFLANMSHELRTPLNSSLILARLLADNPHGNLTADQVNSAETILAAGNDLLTLINDILDLSKIEAGRMEVRPETVWVERLLEDLASVMRPLAEQKGLRFEAASLTGGPHSIETDRQRLEQILKNLLSNAIKFTDRGEVTLTVASTPSGDIQFSVRDTGIGIGPEQQELIFDAFKQVDSAANRKYSGTGLGLSISRQLATLLGGSLAVESQVGRGSVFSVVLPQVYSGSATGELSSGLAADIVAQPNHRVSRREATTDAPPRALVKSRVIDDRQRLSGESRVILVVEDDETFAKLLCELAHELDFQCLIASSAEEALAMVRQYVPSAVILDVGLPDHSGLSVLDRLKHDSRTRHIPVHVVSASDYSEAALALGAVGYMVKPVTRDTLAEALKNLETRLVQRMRRVLVVEDDPVQRDSLRKLLGSHDVETVGVGSAAECLEQLKASTFDCMVLDLSLPDASGYSLLETLSREDSYSFPPVIVYTGRDLTSEEEHKLRRYSKSIIIKGAKSPERLLDEVTLFLHQVVADLPPEQQRMIEKARSREAAMEGRRILVVEDDVRNIFALTSVFEPRGAIVQIARNGREAIEALDAAVADPARKVDLVLMDVMMPEMDGLTATREIRKRPELKKLPIIILTAKAMKEDQENCLAAGANDYIAKPLDVDKLLSLVRVWIRA